MRALCIIVLCVGFYADNANADSPADLVRLLHATHLLQAGYRGQGVRVGIISTGASSYAALVQRQILPSGVTFVGGDANQDDEGDWMLQIVHQIAPKAELIFCASATEPQTVQCADRLVTMFHVNIVVDDLNPQPVYDYPTAKAVGLKRLSESHADVLFFTGAGNNGGGYFEGRWTPTVLSIDGKSYAAEDFGRSFGGDADPYNSFDIPGNADVVVQLGTGVSPSPGDPRQGDGTSQCQHDNPAVILAMVDSQGRLLSSTRSQCPVLQLRYRNGDNTAERIRIAVLLPLEAHESPLRLKLVALRVGKGRSPLQLQYQTPGGAGNSAIAPGIVAVAAVDPNSGWNWRYLYEAFANSGPQCLDYSLTTSDQWEKLLAPYCLQQPAFVTPDRIMVFMPGPAGLEYAPFEGDSSAGPAAAGAAALLLSAKIPPRRIIDLLERSAIAQVSTQGWNPHYGYGLIDADAAAVAGGVMATAPEDDGNLPITKEPVEFRPSEEFLRDEALSLRAQQGDTAALATLKDAAQTGRVDAKTWLAFYAHSIGDDRAAAQWALAASNEGQPIAQSLLGSMYNRGWGLTTDPRAALAWWWCAARAGVAKGMFNMGTSIATGRATSMNAILGYALIRAALIRGLQFPPAEAQISTLKSAMGAQQLHSAEALAAQIASNPSSIPMP